MKRKTIATLMLAVGLSLCAFGATACGDANDGKSGAGGNTGGEKEKTYTVTWKSDDGKVLETDKNVKAGSMPSYDGAIPAKDGTAQCYYVFAGWSPELAKVTADVTYTATFTEYTSRFTVTWKNYDGTVLETDDDVEYGATPEYNGPTPQRASMLDINYEFSGWSPSVGAVTDNVTYTAQFTAKYTGDQVAGVVPKLSEDGKTVQYGFYPQTHVSDQAVTAELDKLEPTSIGWYLLGNDFYAKQTAQVCNGESYAFDDGTAIEDGAEYWFKCDVITWRVLSGENGTYYLLADKLLDTHAYYAEYADRKTGDDTVYANNYERSDIRTWLNGYFYAMAFARDSSYVATTTVSNGATTTAAATNGYACGDTTDKVYLPSYQDYITADYGFATAADDKSATRECKTTDYARARGAWCNTASGLKNNGSYWTRSPSGKYYYCAWNVNSGGYLSEYAVDGASHCVRPCITLSYSA
ncbi:MAG: hypothetical protein K2F90_05810 [Clostridiales bacterium]|nr:hypothetical protein [Clostridiales bacterium]